MDFRAGGEQLQGGFQLRDRFARLAQFGEDRDQFADFLNAAAFGPKPTENFLGLPATLDQRPAGAQCRLLCSGTARAVRYCVRKTGRLAPLR
jgi:hypothetical protein